MDDENYGKRNQETGEWNGMIGELLSQVKFKKQFGFLKFQYIRRDTTNQIFHNLCFVILQKADLAVGDITITYEREQAVDFTMPWMNLGNNQLDLWITGI